MAFPMGLASPRLVTFFTGRFKIFLQNADQVFFVMDDFCQRLPGGTLNNTALNRFG